MLAKSGENAWLKPGYDMLSLLRFYGMSPVSIVIWVISKPGVPNRVGPENGASTDHLPRGPVPSSGIALRTRAKT